MKILKYLCIGIVLCMFAGVITGCGKSMSAEDIEATLEERDVDQIAEAINDYQEQSNKAELDDTVIKYCKDLGEAKNYDDYVFMENLVKEVPDKALKKELQSVVDTFCFAEDVEAVLKTKDIDQIVKVISSYQEQSNKAELDDIIIEYCKSLGESKDFNDYVFMEDLVKKVSDKALKQELQSVVDNSQKNKVIAFITGEWKRRDYTNEDGMVIDVKWLDDNGTAIITKAKLKKNEGDFQKGDVKWRNVKIISKDELSYEELSKSKDDTDYKQAYAKIDFDNNQLVCNITSDSNEEYSHGNKQVWIKKSVIDTSKEVLKTEDFLVTNKEEWEKDDDSWFEFGFNSDLIKNKELRKKVYKWIKEDPNNDIEQFELIKGIKEDIITREMVIDKYSYGHIVFQEPKNDKVYKDMNYFVEEENDYMCKGCAALIEQSEYAVIYDNKNKDKHMKIYFDSKGRLLAVIRYKNDAYTP